MSRYIVKIKCEVLYEELFRILRDYSDYIQKTSQPTKKVLDNFHRMGYYPNKIILCNNEETYNRLKKEVTAFKIELNDVIEKERRNQ